MKTAFLTLLRALESAVDAVLPPRERTARTKSRSAADIPLSPTVHEMLGVRIVTLCDYREKSVEDLIRSLKYDGSPHAARLVADIVADFLREEISSQKLFSQKKILLAAVPLHPSRARERGFNQMSLALRALPKELRDGAIASLTELLVRVRATKPQTRISRRERLSNVAGAFVLSPQALSGEFDISNCHIFLFDDVTTTGATLANAATPLRRAGASVSLIALARA